MLKREGKKNVKNGNKKRVALTYCCQTRFLLLLLEVKMIKGQECLSPTKFGKLK